MHHACPAQSDPVHIRPPDHGTPAGEAGLAANRPMPAASSIRKLTKLGQHHERSGQCSWKVLRRPAQRSSPPQQPLGKHRAVPVRSAPASTGSNNTNGPADVPTRAAGSLTSYQVRSIEWQDQSTRARGTDARQKAWSGPCDSELHDSKLVRLSIGAACGGCKMHQPSA